MMTEIPFLLPIHLLMFYIFEDNCAEHIYNQNTYVLEFRQKVNMQ